MGYLQLRSFVPLHDSEARPAPAEMIRMQVLLIRWALLTHPSIGAMWLPFLYKVQKGDIQRKYFVPSTCTVSPVLHVRLISRSTPIIANEASEVWLNLEILYG